MVSAAPSRATSDLNHGATLHGNEQVPKNVTTGLTGLGHEDYTLNFLRRIRLIAKKLISRRAHGRQKASCIA